MEHHTDKVQAVAWNRFSPQVLLSGSFGHSVVMKDGRIPTHNGFKYSVAADVECLAWDPHTEHSFVVSLENGTVTGFDIRAASSELKPSFTLHAHDKAVCTISYNSLVPNLLATGSMDKMVKLWDLTNNKPTCVASNNPKAGAVFAISFAEDSPFSLAIGGSKGKLQVWDLLSDTLVLLEDMASMPMILDPFPNPEYWVDCRRPRNAGGLYTGKLNDIHDHKIRLYQFGDMIQARPSIY